MVACHGDEWLSQWDNGGNAMFPGRPGFSAIGRRFVTTDYDVAGNAWLLVDTEDAGPVWPTGKLYWALDCSHGFDRFLLMQDSMLVLADPLPWFRDQWQGSGAVAWQRFPMQWDTPDQCHAVEARYRSRPSHGIFGPIFYTDRASLLELDARGLLPETPHDRLSANATERAWAYAFEQAGMPVVGPEWRPDLITAGLPFGPFVKKLANREPLGGGA